MKKRLKKISIVQVLIVVAALITMFGVKNAYDYVVGSVNPIKKLSAERQAAYDKMKVISLNIGERKTGTAPFNQATTSNTEGVDINDTDDYVRTFDKILYTLEVGIGPNTSVSGVENSSIFNGGVIKVRAKLPNQGDNTTMRWVKDAWMSNVEFSNDNTEIYAEYIVPTNESVTNAVQNLSFTVEVDGYKKEITNSMKPTFEVWMEGNKPDNTSSSIEASTIKDNNNIIISGHPSYDVELINSSLSNKEYKNDVYGQYSSFGLGLSLKQDVEGFNDLRGIEYPNGKIDIEMLLDYSYKTDNGYTKLDGNNINDTEIIAYNKNQLQETYGSIYPENVTRLNCIKLPYGKKGTSSENKSVQDTGDIVANLNGNKLSLSVENYKLNGKFPTKPSADEDEYSKSIGYFGSINIQLFIPFYVDSDSNTHDAKINIKASSLKYKVASNEIETPVDASNVIQDTSISNNEIEIELSQQIQAYVGLFLFSELDSKYSQPDAYFYDGKEFRTALQIDNGPDRYEGGTDNLIVWNPNKIEMLPYEGDNYYYLQSSYSMLGFSSYSTEGMKDYFGVYKEDNDNGPQTLEKINSATYDDFDWYESYEEAETHGKVSGYKFVFPENKGRNYRYVIYNKFKAKVTEEDYGKTTTMRAKARIFLDAEKKRAATSQGYTSEGVFYPTQYDENGLVNYGENPSQGETYLMIEAAANTKTSVTDKDSSNNLKKIYDVQDEEINFEITPELTNEKTASNTDKTMDNVYVRTTLPAGLGYKEGSANKEPSKITLNPDGTTLLEWKYDNWQINHDAPEYSKITFKAEISASIENNKQLEIKTTTSAPNDVRDLERYRTSSYKIEITNLLGIQAIKETSKSIVNTNESFIVTSTIGNNSGDALTNIKGIEFLPGKDSSNESIIDGTYTLAIKELSSNQKLYYTTANRNVLGIVKDAYGKDSIQDIDLDSDDKWIEVTQGTTLPINATAIATSIQTINPGGTVTFKYEVTPTSNKTKNIYTFAMDITTDSTGLVVSSNTVVTKVINRQIKGIYFEDNNKNGVYDDTDTLISNKKVKVYDLAGTKIKETTTDSNGKYTLDSLEKNTYIVEFEDNGNNYEVIESGTEDNSSKANTNYRTSNIDQTVDTNSDNYVINNINIGIRKKASQVKTNHIYKDSDQTFKTETQDKYFGDSYTTSKTNEIPPNYEYDSTVGVAQGVVNSSEIVVNYYYKKKASSIDINLTATATKKITKKDSEVSYKITATGSIVDYIGNGTVTLTSQVPFEIDEENSILDGGTYNKETNTITWTINKNVNTYENSNKNIGIEKNLKVVYKNITSSDRKITNNVSVRVELDNNESNKTTQVETDIEVKGKIKVYYYEKDKDGQNKEIKTSEELVDYVGEEVEIEGKDIKGFSIIEKPNEINYTYLEEEQIVMFVYKRKEYKITTTSTTDDGTIKNGSQTVIYGEDSDVIVIKSDKDYCIETITINGKEKNINVCDDEYKLEFKDMDESKNIVVSYKKMPTNPNTSDSIMKFIILCIISFVGLITYTFINKKKRRI